METNNELRAVKEFNHPVETVYSAWTEPRQLKQWWQPMNATLEDVKNDIKESGEIEYRFSTKDQDDFVVTGQYSEVKPNERLVYGWNWKLPNTEEEEYQLTVHFASTDSGTKLEVIQEGFSDQEKIAPHQQGWDRGLSDLASYLDGSSNSRPAGAIDDHIPVVGYGGNGDES